MTVCPKRKNNLTDENQLTFSGVFFIWMNIAACAGLIAAILIFHRAQPEFETFFDRYYHLQLRRYWDPCYIRLLVGVLGVGTLINATGLFLARYRGGAVRITENWYCC